jgi:type I restriction enzyme M protein
VGDEAIDDFSAALDYNEIKEKNYSFSAGQYFDIKIDYSEITDQEFKKELSIKLDEINKLFAHGSALSNKITDQLDALGHE